jgi:EAL domain-containing protein (putative c-di-GMP-specific phosphodiesterase class I)
MCMSINISGQSIGDPESLSFLAQQLSRSGLAPGSVMIEISEQTAIATRGNAADRLRKLCSRGYAFGKPEPLDSVPAGVRAEFPHRAVR